MKSKFVYFPLVAILLLSGCDTFPNPFGPNNSQSAEWVLKWNRIAIDTAGLDHTPLKKDENRVFGHQLGPGRSSLAMAIVHIAMFDAINAVEGGFKSYTGLNAADPDTSVHAAIAQSAHDTLVALYPSHLERLVKLLDDDLAEVSEGDSKTRGIALGKSAAHAILVMRAKDNSDAAAEYHFSDQPGKWRVDPMNPDQQPLGNMWGQCLPFVLDSPDQFRAPPPPAMASLKYAEAFDEVQLYGGDGVNTPTLRSEEQSQIGIYWAYDGTPSLCAPPRLYNQIAAQLGTERGLGLVDMARLLALVNTAMADAGVAIWESKYYYNVWRPVTGIREADQGMGPTGLGDGNPMTVADPNFFPMGAPASNTEGNNFTPPFPAYPSGHAGFGGALFETLRKFFGTDDIAFTFVSDELNGVTVNSHGNARPLIPRSFTSLSQAEDENGQSRIYLGIHWSFDKTEGITMGRKVADQVFEHSFQPN